MKRCLFITVFVINSLIVKVAFGQEVIPKAMSIPQQIGGFISGASPFIIIGLGILLIFIQKLAKFIGIILLVIGLIRLALLFIH
ncbi:MAG: hypothetical protein HS132_16795 [Planctomycetia bacterium]|nr:hypothetical protein [Planctomycetia bacterium]